MKRAIGDQEADEVEEIERSEGLQKIRMLMERHRLDLKDIQSVLPPCSQKAAPQASEGEQRQFDPFFDAW